jgi:hypothetical protein
VSAPNFEGRPTKHAFGTNLSFMMGKPVVAWAHGHTHYNTKLDVEGTTVFSNQHGYAGENCGPKFDSGRVLSIKGGGAKAEW